MAGILRVLQANQFRMHRRRLFTPNRRGADAVNVTFGDVEWLARLHLRLESRISISVFTFRKNGRTLIETCPLWPLVMRATMFRRWESFRSHSYLVVQAATVQTGQPYASL